MEVDTNIHSHDAYYDKVKYNEPRQKLFAVMRYEKAGSTDRPGWIFKIITQDQAELLNIARLSVALPNTDNQSYVSNAEDVIIVEIIPSDIWVKKI